MCGEIGTSSASLLKIDHSKCAGFARATIVSPRIFSCIGQSFPCASTTSRVRSISSCATCARIRDCSSRTCTSSSIPALLLSTLFRLPPSAGFCWPRFTADCTLSEHTSTPAICVLTRFRRRRPAEEGAPVPGLLTGCGQCRRSKTEKERRPVSTHVTSPCVSVCTCFVTFKSGYNADTHAHTATDRRTERESYKQLVK